MVVGEGAEEMVIVYVRKQISLLIIFNVAADGCVCLTL
jgi:hypothetical protein